MVKTSTSISIASVKRSMERTGKFLVKQSGKSLTLTRMYGGKAMSCRLTKLENQKLLDLDLNYHFKSSNSHFDYRKGETRLCRNKSVISSFLNDLKKAEVWHLVDKSFLQLNENNKKTRKNKKVQRELDNLLNS